MAKWSKEGLEQLAKEGLTPEQINLLLSLSHQRKVVGSNVVLSPAELAEHQKRFEGKKYTGSCEVPLKPRLAQAIQTKHKLNKNLTDKQVEELIAAEKKYGRKVLRLTPQEVRGLLKTGLWPDEVVEE